MAPEATDGAALPGAVESGTAALSLASAPSVAVLPFVYLSGDSTQAYIASAIADAITGALAAERDLRVSSRSAAEALQRRIASGDTTQLPVQTLVEGVVEVEGNRVRLSVRLVNAADGFTLYADRVEGERGNLFALEDDVAHGMQELLRAHFRLPRQTACAGSRLPLTGWCRGFRTAQAEFTCCLTGRSVATLRAMVTARHSTHASRTHARCLLLTLALLASSPAGWTRSPARQRIPARTTAVRPW